MTFFNPRNLRIAPTRQLVTFAFEVRSWIVCRLHPHVAQIRVVAKTVMLMLAKASVLQRFLNEMIFERMT